MTIEREFLKKLRYATHLENDLRKELEELLAQPERNWVEYQRGHSTAALELKRNLENIFIGMGL